MLGFNLWVQDLNHHCDETDDCFLAMFWVCQLICQFGDSSSKSHQNGVEENIVLHLCSWWCPFLSNWFSPFFIQRLNLSCSVPMILAYPLLITWFLSTTWSVIAELWTVVSDSFLPALVVTLSLTFSTSDLCSSHLVLNFVSVSPNITVHAKVS